MKIQIYDWEVSAFDHLVVFQDFETEQFTVFHNDPDGVKYFINDDTIYIGFNSKNYDQFITKAVCTGASVEEVKELNDYLIHGENGWEHWLIQDKYFRFNNVDIMDDMQMGLSLKAIEGHLGMDIRETTVRFDLPRPWNQQELEEMIYYCKHDVAATREVVKIRKKYLQTKMNIGRMVGISDAKALSMTNAKLTASFLKANAPSKQRTDERLYTIPENLLTKYIPDEVFNFFGRMRDDRVPYDEVFKAKININVGECPVTIGFGGIHGAIPNYIWQEGNGRIIRNYDVGSFYPHLMTVNGYTSRNIPDPKIYADMLETRMRAKKAGDKKTANSLKLIANTTYGAMLNRYNDLYDPLMGRSVCVSGQLYLLELSNHLYQTIPNIKVIQLNTDGIMVEFDESNYSQVLDITDEWQKRTGFELEEDKIVRIVQKDVNNYIEIQSDGSAKTKGGYLVKGISQAGAFKVNNNAVIVATAIREYFVHGIDPAETINGCDDIFQFQMIAKAGAKYREAYHLVDGEKMPVQKVNRVYATSDPRYGKIYKVKAETDAEAKIDSLPEHCMIDNDNHCTIADIDKQFYIDLANKRIHDFKGLKPDKKGESKWQLQKKLLRTCGAN